MGQNKIQKHESNKGLSKSLDRALRQVKEGKVSPHAEVRKKYEKWLQRLANQLY